jgi:UDP-N-acetylglucosamine 2-epimerase (non-hydrolysing)
MPESQLTSLRTSQFELSPFSAGDREGLVIGFAFAIPAGGRRRFFAVAALDRRFADLERSKAMNLSLKRNQKCAVVLGTRPEIIKLAPVIHELERRNADFFIVHSGQHFSDNMDRVFWDTFLLPPPRYHLGVRERTHARQTAEMLRQLDEIFDIEKPDWVIVQGDTNTVLAGGLCASKRDGIRVAHVEAGLRSFDRTMPEETNRIIVDHISDILFAPTEEAAFYLRQEGIPQNRIQVVGNTIEDILTLNLAFARVQSRIVKELELKSKGYILMTVHRQENTEDAIRLIRILESVVTAAEQHDLQCVFPIHPRTRAKLEALKFELPDRIRLTEPLGYHDFLSLADNAAVIATDSGGLQEEACIMRVPCVTLRENTERPETVEIGANHLAGVSREGIIGGIDKMLKIARDWKSPYGGGKASRRIIGALLDTPAAVAEQLSNLM